MAERGRAYRTERQVFGGTGLFLIPWTVIYVVSTDEPAGGLLLGACSVALLALAGYFEWQARRVDRRPSDVDVPATAGARVPPATPGTAHPPDMSVWPLVMAGAATLLCFGLAFTVWVAIPAGLLLVFGVLGYAREA
jgi:hypothetical protein